MGVPESVRQALADRYTIEREIGGGGMSRVFLAEETALGRRVVIKLLPAELSGSVSIERFRREIALAARLQHPHIVPLLAAGEIDGQPYFTMPYVEGESLRAGLSRGELSIAATISILRDLARALEFAHARGVTHRDVKPDNVLLAGTSAMLADLGVAKAISEAAEDRPLTSVGVSVGTPAYMAPEQAAADPTTDFRADIYAFGAVAYEMLAGHPPFAGRSPQAMLAAHATLAPPLISALRPATPPRLADLVMRCLEKRPGDRPQSAAELMRVLDALGTPADGLPALAPPPGAERSGRRILIAAGIAAACLLAGGAWWWRVGSRAPSAGQIRAIAVLPLENTSGDTTIDYLEDGVTDHVRDALNAVPGLTVKARSSSQQAKGRSPHAIGAALGVGAVLQGTVSHSGTRLHVTTELVRTADDNALWSRTFDGQASELAGIQDTIAADVAKALGLSLAGGAGPLASRGTADLGAYDSFLRGRAAYDRLRFPQAVLFFREALARDPKFALAEGYLAMSYANEPTLDIGPIDSVDGLASAAAARALAIDSTVVEAYIAQSFVLLTEMRFGDALAPLARAMAIDSTNANLLTAYGITLVQAGRLDEGQRLARQAVERDPLSAQAVGIYSYILGLSGESKAAIAHMRTAQQLDPGNPLPYRALGYEFAFAGMPDSAVAAFEAGMRLDSVAFGGRSSLLFGYAAAGRWSDVDRQRAQLERESWEPNYSRMVADLVEGDTAAAMTSLERGVAAREQYLGIISMPCDPLFDPLKTNRRFATLMGRIGARACPATLAWPVGRRPPGPRNGQS